MNDEMPFDHVVVVMMENHSFDNLLGALSLENPAVDGLRFENGSPIDWNPGIEGMPEKVLAFPFPDTAQASEVSQTWKDAHEQINGGLMDGFVRSTKATQPMGYYTSETLPFAYSLASTFAVGTRWFCSLPGPTYPNRRFLLAGTAYGCTVTNSETLLELPPPNGTILDLLSNHNIDWRNYFSDIPMTMVIPTTIIDHPEHHVPIGNFFDDCEAGTLPAVSFVDPGIGALSRIGKPIATLPPLLQHFLARIEADLKSDSAQTEEDPQDMYEGELWAHSVVDAVLRSPCWPRTLLIYIYDEHGGYYDHVVPPSAPLPDNISPKLQSGDPQGSYDMYGPRVPAIVVSPYSKPSGVTETLHDHTSVLATIEAKWNLPALTDRDARATTVMDFLESNATFHEPPEIAAPSPTGSSGPTPPKITPPRTPSPQTSADTDNANTDLNMNNASNAPDTGSETQQNELTFKIALIGIGAVLVAFAIAVWAFHGSKEPGQVIPAVVGAVTATVGTLAGLVAGHSAGAAGKAQSDQRASNNERDAAAGRALAQTMLADGGSSAPAASERAMLEGHAAGAQHPDETAVRHAELAERLFPDLT